MRCVILVAALLVIVPHAALAKELTPAQKAIADKYLKRVGAKGDIPKKFVFRAAPEKNAKEGIGFVVLYTHEDPDGLGGNSYVQNLAIFSTPEDGNSLLLTQRVGGKTFREVSLLSVSPRTVDFSTLSYSDDDPACCPSLKGRISYYLEGNRLRERREGVSANR